MVQPYGASYGKTQWFLGHYWTHTHIYMAFLLGISSTKYGKSCGDEVPPNFHGRSHEDLIEWLKIPTTKKW